MSGQVGSHAGDSVLQEGPEDFPIALGKVTLAVKVKGRTADSHSRIGMENVPPQTVAVQLDVFLAAIHCSGCRERRSSSMRQASLLRSFRVKAR